MEIVGRQGTRGADIYAYAWIKMQNQAFAAVKAVSFKLKSIFQFEKSIRTISYMFPWPDIAQVEYPAEQENGV